MGGRRGRPKKKNFFVLRPNVREKYEKIVSETKPGCCMFCGDDHEEELVCDKIRRHETFKLQVHYFCLLFSTHLHQYNDDQIGINGFKINDIINELISSREKKCIYCDKVGASLYCAEPKCRAVFHMSCGRGKGALFQFFEKFKAYCYDHVTIDECSQRKTYDFKRRPRFYGYAYVRCAICRAYVVSRPDRSVVRSPCCKQAYFHWICVQKQALSAGEYNLRCSLCNDNDIFKRHLLERGVYIPIRDSAWEMDSEDRYGPMYERPSQCSAENCRHPEMDVALSSRIDTRNFLLGPASFVFCYFCGSAAIHEGCMTKKNRKSNYWLCASCRTSNVKNPHDFNKSSKTMVKPKALTPASSTNEKNKNAASSRDSSADSHSSSIAANHARSRDSPSGHSSSATVNQHSMLRDCPVANHSSTTVNRSTASRDSPAADHWSSMADRTRSRDSSASGHSSSIANRTRSRGSSAGHSSSKKAYNTRSRDVMRKKSADPPRLTNRSATVAAVPPSESRESPSRRDNGNGFNNFAVPAQITIRSRDTGDVTPKKKVLANHHQEKTQKDADTDDSGCWAVPNSLSAKKRNLYRIAENESDDDIPGGPVKKRYRFDDSDDDVDVDVCTDSSMNHRLPSSQSFDEDQPGTSKSFATRHVTSITSKSNDIIRDRKNNATCSDDIHLYVQRYLSVARTDLFKLDSDSDSNASVDVENCDEESYATARTRCVMSNLGLLKPDPDSAKPDSDSDSDTDSDSNPDTDVDILNPSDAEVDSQKSNSCVCLNDRPPMENGDSDDDVDKDVKILFCKINVSRSV